MPASFHLGTGAGGQGIARTQRIFSGQITAAGGKWQPADDLAQTKGLAQGQAFSFFTMVWGPVVFIKKIERAMGIENMDKEQNRLGGNEIIYRAVGGVCAAMALRSP
jgi:hypothetical protein